MRQYNAPDHGRRHRRTEAGIAQLLHPEVTPAAGAGPVAGRTSLRKTRTSPLLRTQLPSVGSRCVEYISIRQAKELNMKRLLGLLLVIETLKCEGV